MERDPSENWDSGRFLSRTSKRRGLKKEWTKPKDLASCVYVTQKLRFWAPYTSFFFLAAVRSVRPLQ